MSLVLESVSQRYDKKEVIHSACLELEHGIYGFLGPNGAGKSTMLRMLSTVERPSLGEIFYEGRDIFQMGEAYSKRQGIIRILLCINFCSILQH